MAYVKGLGQLEYKADGWIEAHTRPSDLVHLYIVECWDYFPYVGVTKEPLKRMKDHWTGEGSQKCREHIPYQVRFISPGVVRRDHIEMVEFRVKRQYEYHWYSTPLDEYGFPDPIPAFMEQVENGGWIWEQLIGRGGDIDDVRERCRQATDYYTPARARRRAINAPQYGGDLAGDRARFLGLGGAPGGDRIAL